MVVVPNVSWQWLIFRVRYQGKISIFLKMIPPCVTSNIRLLQQRFLKHCICFYYFVCDSFKIAKPGLVSIPPLLLIISVLAQCCFVSFHKIPGRCLSWICFNLITLFILNDHSSPLDLKSLFHSWMETLGHRDVTYFRSCIRSVTEQGLVIPVPVPCLLAHLEFMKLSVVTGSCNS